MMSQIALPSWNEVFHQLGEPEPRRNRSRCPIHNGDSLTSLSINEERGLFHCFVCGAGGDKIDFVRRIRGCDYKSALQILGVPTEGASYKPSPEMQRQHQSLQAIRMWCKSAGRKLQDEIYVRERVITRAIERLKHDPEDAWAWNWLGWALPGKEALEYRHDEIGLARTDEERIAAWRAYHNVL